MIYKVMLCYGRLVSLTLSINTRMADVLNNFSLKYMLNHEMLYMSHVIAKPVCVIVLHNNIHGVVSASAYRRSWIRVKVMSVICAIFCRVRETCLVTRLAHAYDSR